MLILSSFVEEQELKNLNLA